MNNKVIAVLIGGFAGGVTFASFVDFGWPFALFLAVVAFALVLGGRVAAGQTAFAPPLLIVFIFAFAFGVLRLNLSDTHTFDPVLENHLGSQVTLIGTVEGEPDERETSARLNVSVRTLRDNGKDLPVNMKVLAVVPVYPKFNYGDNIEVKGLLDKPQNFSDPAGKIFDYRAYLAVSGIRYEISRASARFLDAGYGNVVVAGLFSFKRFFLSKISALIPEPHASLLGGLIVGAKRSLGQNLLDDFRRAGVIHVVVLSGYNITIVAEAVMKFFGFFLPRFFGQAFGALGIVLFAIMTGGSATVVRASLMALLVIFARAVSRKYDIVRALFLAGFLMVMQNPKILIFDSSFQLSFMSTLALIYVSPLIEKHLKFVPEKFGIRSVVTATLSTQIFVLPLLLYKMGELSTVALPVNLLILSIVPATMLFGFLAGSVGLVSLAIAFPFAAISYGLLAYELAVVEFFSHLPFAAFAMSVPLWLMLLWYGAYAIIFRRLRGGKPAPAIPYAGIS